ncbi:MAG TPA: hypothetical protein VIM85_04155 [Pseudomonadales bacterium]
MSIAKHCLSIALITLFCAGSTLAADTSRQDELKDLYFGEALFQAYQKEYFAAISRLDTELAQYYGLDEPNLSSLYHHIGDAEFSVGDYELYYRMHNRASRAIKAVIEGNVEDVVRNAAGYRLAKIYYQKNQPLNALHAIEKVKGKIPEHLRYEEAFLRAQIYMVNGKFTDAINLLEPIENAEGVKGFAGYNLAIALLQSGKEEQGLAQLNKVGQISSSDEQVLGIKDKANLVLGFRLLEAGQAEPAKQFLDRVRLTGPFSNKALLGSGWAAAAMGKFDRALVPWQMLAKRNITNKSVQEIMLGVPYAYGKLGIHGKAAILYGQALESYSKELERVDASIKSIREGKFLAAVIGEELKADKNWLIKLRELPNTPETHYLIEMLASHDFQESLKNYFDMVELQKKMSTWLKQISAFEEIIAIRSAYYQPLLPDIEKQFRILDSKMKLRIQQRDRLDKRLKKMLISPKPELLATADERILLHQIMNLENDFNNRGLSNNDPLMARISRLKGRINWSIYTEYDIRLTDAHKHLHQLDEHVNQLDKSYKSFVRTRQAATQSYKGYDNNLQQLTIKINQAQTKINTLISRQGYLLEQMAVSELELRRQRLEEYQVKARFALAESYDRATKKQEERKEEQLKIKDDTQ